MNMSQAARYKAYALALTYLKENEVITKDLPAFGEAWQAAKATLDAVVEADNLRQQNRQGIIASKKQYLADISHQAMAVSSAIVSYASANKDNGLKETMTFTPSELSYTSIQQLGARVSNILNTAKNLREELKKYGISEEVLTGFARLVELYLPSANLPRINTTERKNARLRVIELLRQLQEQMDNQIDKLMIQFRLSHPEFYNQYIISRTIVNPGYRKTRVEGVVTDKATRAVLGEVEVQVKDSNLATATMADGSYSLKTPALSGATVIYQKKGFKPFTVLLEIKRGQILRQAVEMEKAE